MANSESASERAQPKLELPITESPSISPAEIQTAAEPVAETFPKPAAAVEEIAVTEVRKHSRFILRPRHKRHALFAASGAIAAAFGALVGAAITGGFSGPTAVDVATEENKATQQSVARLAKEITSLKTSLDAASKSANSQIAKISERLGREGADATGSVTPSQAVPPAARPAPIAADLPSSRLRIVTDWSIREARDGFIYVQGHGDVYQVVPGAPLPGLGPVEQIKRQDGRWLVVTPKGIIVSMRDRRYFEQF
jgi:hypothetical protein